MPTDIEQKVLVADGAADSAHVDRIFLDDDDRRPLLAQAIGGRETGRPRADDQDLDMLRHDRTKPEGPVRNFKSAVRANVILCMHQRSDWRSHPEWKPSHRRNSL